MNYQAAYDYLREYIAALATCPCCEQADECHPECTMFADCPREWQLMQQHREALVEAQKAKGDAHAP